MANSRDLAEIEAENIISAKILLKIRTIRRKKDVEDNKKALTALIKSTENDDIIITAKNGKKMRGSSFVVNTVLDLETTKSGFPVERQIEDQMRNFAEGIRNVEAVM